VERGSSSIKFASFLRVFFFYCYRRRRRLRKTNVDNSPRQLSASELVLIHRRRELIYRLKILKNAHPPQPCSRKTFLSQMIKRRNSYRCFARTRGWLYRSGHPWCRVKATFARTLIKRIRSPLLKFCYKLNYIVIYSAEFICQMCIKKVI